MKKLIQEEWIQKAKEVHGDKYDYSKIVYINARTPVKVICITHGEFEQNPNNHLHSAGCWECRNINKTYNNNDFIEKAKKVHDNKYNYSKSKYTKSQNKVSIICHDHGVFEQTPANHLSGAGCPICSNKNIGNLKRSNTEEFIQKAKVIHGNKYDYSKVNYINARTKVIIICKKKNHRKFEQLPSIHLLGVGCPSCNSSKGELAIKAILDKHGIENISEWKFPDEKYLFEYDFYLPKLNVLIEFHGIQHYKHILHFHRTYEKFRKAQERDIFKKDLVQLKRIPFIEFNYKQFGLMTKEKFEEFVLNKLKYFIKNTEEEVKENEQSI